MFQVVWRYTGVPPVDVPKNVKLMKWLPQNDLLGMFIQIYVCYATIMFTLNQSRF